MKNNKNLLKWLISLVVAIITIVTIRGVRIRSSEFFELFIFLILFTLIFRICMIGIFGIINGITKNCDVCGKKLGVPYPMTSDGFCCSKCYRIACNKTNITPQRVSQVKEMASDDFPTFTQQPVVDNVPKCPLCKSTSITANQKGFGVGKAVIGAAVAGPLGLIAGNAGAKKVYITCLNCGHRWKAGKH